MHENENLGCPLWTLHTLTFSVPDFPLSPLSMIHCFLGPFPLHPIDGFQNCFNFQALTCWGDGQGSVCAVLWIVQGHRRGEEGGRQSIYQDVLFYFFYPSPRRWFYFSENPLNSDQVRWLLSLETQELSDSNQYKCWTSTWGARSPTVVFQGSFWSFLLLNSQPVILIYVPFQLFLQEIQIWLRHWEWTSYRQFRPSVQTPWPP